MRRLTRRQQIAAVVLSVVALLFISLDFAGGSLGGARSGTTGALGSLYRGTDAVLGPVRRFVQGVPDVSANRHTIAQLRQDNAALRRELTAAQADASTARQLKALQLQADSTRWSILPARVVATSPSSGFQWTVTIDVGAREQVSTGLTVTDGAGLVGRVVAVHATTSVVLLTADPESGVGVRDTRTGGLLLAAGAGNRGVTATPLDGRSDVRAGDHLVTGPAGQTTYAHGIDLGVVSSVSRSATGSLVATVRPSAGQQGLDLVGIVLNGPRVAARAALVPDAGR